MSTSSRPVALLVASLGNAAPYLSTRHSAGHVALKNLQTHLNMPSLSKSKAFGGGLVSDRADVGKPFLTLWQSPSMMNTSGVALLKAYKQFTTVHQTSSSDDITGLIILHDEMELDPGKLKVRRGATSAKGHNGIKSVQQSLQSAGILEKLGQKFVKIGIGIGRPQGGSRQSDDVSKFVLGRLTAEEQYRLEGATPELENLLYQEMARMATG